MKMRSLFTSRRFAATVLALATLAGWIWIFCRPQSLGALTGVNVEQVTHMVVYDSWSQEGGVPWRTIVEPKDVQAVEELLGFRFRWSEFYFGRAEGKENEIFYRVTFGGPLLNQDDFTEYTFTLTSYGDLYLRSPSGHYLPEGDVAQLQAWLAANHQTAT